MYVFSGGGRIAQWWARRTQRARSPKSKCDTVVGGSSPGAASFPFWPLASHIHPSLRRALSSWGGSDQSTNRKTRQISNSVKCSLTIKLYIIIFCLTGAAWRRAAPQAACRDARAPRARSPPVRATPTSGSALARPPWRATAQEDRYSTRTRSCARTVLRSWTDLNVRVDANRKSTQSVQCYASEIKISFSDLTKIIKFSSVYIMNLLCFYLSIYLSFYEVYSRCRNATHKLCNATHKRRTK